MNKQSRILIAGRNRLVGSAAIQRQQEDSSTNIMVRSHTMDLKNKVAIIKLLHATCLPERIVSTYSRSLEDLDAIRKSSDNFQISHKIMVVEQR